MKYFKTVILCCLDEFIAGVLTDIALDQIIHIYRVLIKFEDIATLLITLE